MKQLVRDLDVHKIDEATYSVGLGQVAVKQGVVLCTRVRTACNESGTCRAERPVL